MHLLLVKEVLEDQ